MFGYVIFDKQGLQPEETARYQGLYCGLCHALKRQFGHGQRWCLSFDMTFLALFLSALYEPGETGRVFRCALHPFRPKRLTENPFTEYAAYMSVALAYHKCLDDWEDEHKITRGAYGRLLRGSYLKTRQKYPRQCRVIAESLDELADIEKYQKDRVDEAVNCSGRMLSELFVYKEDYWSGRLRHFGYELGRFIYLMDAAMDVDKDKKTGNYNPLLQLGKTAEEMEPIMGLAIGGAAEEFEQLPIVKDGHLIRNILYAGVWQKYYARLHGKEASHG